MLPFEVRYDSAETQMNTCKVIYRPFSVKQQISSSEYSLNTVHSSSNLFRFILFYIMEGYMEGYNSIRFRSRAHLQLGVESPLHPSANDTLSLPHI